MIRLAIVFILFSFTASAEPISLTLGQAVSAFNALNALGGYEKIVKEAAVDKVISVHYKFQPGVVFILAKNISALRPVAVTALKTQMDLREQIAPNEEKIEPGSLQDTKLKKQTADVTAIVQTVDLIKFRLSDLNMDAPELNPITPDVLAALLPMIDETESKK